MKKPNVALTNGELGDLLAAVQRAIGDVESCIELQPAATRPEAPARLAVPTLDQGRSRRLQRLDLGAEKLPRGIGSGV